MRFVLSIGGRALLMAALSTGTFACSRQAAPGTEGSAPAPPPPPEAAGPADAEPPGLLELCRLPSERDDLIDETRRVLAETFCGATLWFDGLFGAEADVANARATSGRAELSTLYSEFHGWSVGGRLRLRYNLPTLERRVNLFLGRGDRKEIVQGREEGLAIRSSTLGRKSEEKWLAGLGYSPPGSWGQRLDIRLGARPRLSPEVFAHLRLRKNVLVSDVSVWRFRETLFWENHEGFGATTNIEYDRVLTPDAVFHWSTAGTLSEASQGLDWRSAAILYHNLGSRRAVAGELFARGATSAEVPLREYGARAVYRQPVFRPFLFGELVIGYSWPRHELREIRSGAPMIGIGTEMLFGRTPP